MDQLQVKENDQEKKCEDKIHLFVSSNPKSSEAAVAIRWCICPSILKKIKEFSGKNPHILLIATREGGGEVDRKIVPLQQEMEYFYFQGKGLHRIQATIICVDEDVSRLKSVLLEKGHSCYHCDALREGVIDQEYLGRNLYVYGRISTLQVGQGEIEVDVAQEFFAKKPAKWLWNWVNLWYETEPKDECHFRKRCMLAFSIQPPVLFVYATVVCIFRLLAALFLVLGIGMRRVDFAPILHPLRDYNKDVWFYCDCENGGSVFLTDKDGKNRPNWLFFLMPVVWISLLGVFSLSKIFLMPSLTVWHSVLIFFSVLAGLLISIYFVIFGIYLTNTVLLKKGKKTWAEIEEQLEKQEKQKKIAFESECDKNYSSIVCQGKPLEARLKALPRPRRTIYLRFMDLKVKVCRPFSK